MKSSAPASLRGCSFARTNARPLAAAPRANGGRPPRNARASVAAAAGAALPHQTAAPPATAAAAAPVAPAPATSLQAAAAGAGGPTAAAAAAPRAAQAGVAAAALAAAGAGAYGFLSSQPSLPPLPDTLTALGAGAGALLGAAAACAAAAKAALGDKFHVELHRGRLYVSVGVPSQGPPLRPGAVAVRPAADPRLGNGAFAVERILAGTYLGDYTGDKLSRAAFFERYPDGVGDYATAVDDEWAIDAVGPVADTSRFHPVHMNHSSGRANVRRFYRRSEGRISFFAARDIEPGEELLYDYGRDYWRGREHMELP